MKPALRPRPPQAPSLPTQSHLSELLDENAALLSAAHTFQQSGRIIESIEYLRRSQANVVAMSRFLRKQYDQERQTASGENLAAEPVKAIALKRPSQTRKKKVGSEESEFAHQPMLQQTEGEIIDTSKPLDMPSLS
jgi:hypothetical protein